MMKKQNNSKKAETGFIQSVSSNTAFEPKSLEQLKAEKEAYVIQQDSEDNNDDAQSSMDSESSTVTNNEQKGKKVGSILDILDKKPAGPLKPIPFPLVVHQKINQLSGVCDYGMGDIVSSIILHTLDQHKDEIRKMIQKKTLNEWK